MQLGFQANIPVALKPDIVFPAGTDFFQRSIRVHIIDVVLVFIRRDSAFILYKLDSRFYWFAEAGTTMWHWFQVFHPSRINKVFFSPLCGTKWFVNRSRKTVPFESKNMARVIYRSRENLHFMTVLQLFSGAYNEDSPRWKSIVLGHPSQAVPWNSICKRCRLILFMRTFWKQHSGVLKAP